MESTSRKAGWSAFISEKSHKNRDQRETTYLVNCVEVEAESPHCEWTVDGGN